jgi:hypothetical protein
MTAGPEAPWTLRGELLVALAGGRRTSFLPADFRPLPGPSLVIAERITDSPVGPHAGLLVAEPARIGLRPGFCVTTAVTTCADGRVASHLNWGVPSELGTLRWSSNGDERELSWEERGIVIRGSAGRLGLPFLVPFRALQRRADGPVLVPGRLRAWVRLAKIDVEVPDDDPMVELAGRHPGAVLAAPRLVVQPARHPFGLFSSLRAPLRAAEPALAGRGDALVSAAPSRALSSAG